MTTRGLVLGGGDAGLGAWQVGVLHGLAEEGVDLTTADRVVGTAIGAVVGAQITGHRSVSDLYADLLEMTEPMPPPGPIRTSAISKLAWARMRARGDVERFGRLLGRECIAEAERGRVPSVQERYDAVAERIGGLSWPDRDLVVTAVDAHTGRLAAFGPGGIHAHVPLEDAVNASWASPMIFPPIPIGGRTYVDGGVRSDANADLAAGCDVVVAVAALEKRTGWLVSATEQLEEIGMPFHAIAPGVPDVTQRPQLPSLALSARNGRRDAAAHADAVGALWG